MLDAHVSIRQAGELLGAKKLSRFAFNGKFVKRRFCPEKLLLDSHRISPQIRNIKETFYVEDALLLPKT